MSYGRRTDLKFAAGGSVVTLICRGGDFCLPGGLEIAILFLVLEKMSSPDGAGQGAKVRMPNEESV